jgi:hypothetical protein
MSAFPGLATIASALAGAKADALESDHAGDDEGGAGNIGGPGGGG